MSLSLPPAPLGEIEGPVPPPAKPEQKPKKESKPQDSEKPAPPQKEEKWFFRSGLTLQTATSVYYPPLNDLDDLDLGGDTLNSQGGRITRPPAVATDILAGWSGGIQDHRYFPKNSILGSVLGGFAAYALQNPETSRYLPIWTLQAGVDFTYLHRFSRFFSFGGSATALGTFNYTNLDDDDKISIQEIRLEASGSVSLVFALRCEAFAFKTGWSFRGLTKYADGIPYYDPLAGTGPYLGIVMIPEGFRKNPNGPDTIPDPVLQKRINQENDDEKAKKLESHVNPRRTYRLVSVRTNHDGPIAMEEYVFQDDNPSHYTTYTKMNGKKVVDTGPSTVILKTNRSEFAKLKPGDEIKMTSPIQHREGDTIYAGGVGTNLIKQAK